MSVLEKSAEKSSQSPALNDTTNQLVLLLEQIPWLAILEQVRNALLVGLSFYAVFEVLKVLNSLADSFSDDENANAAKLSALAKKLKRPEIATMTFDRHELQLIDEIIGPDEIDVTFNDIGGMEAQLEDVKDHVVLPMQLWNKLKQLGATSESDASRLDIDMDLASCPSGVLLYGAPGTGKSLTAKAIAKGNYFT